MHGMKAVGKRGGRNSLESRIKKGAVFAAPEVLYGKKAYSSGGFRRYSAGGSPVSFLNLALK